MKTDAEKIEYLSTQFNTYLQSIDNKFNSKYYFNFYYPFIDINNSKNCVLRVNINSYDRGNNSVKLKDLLVNELMLLNKYLPIYYETYGLDQSIFDIYIDELIRMMKNKNRKDKLQKLCLKEVI